ncbi:hypothetical protein BKA70DRAFT_1578101 [Coprinopsis sp. MPI-PUGE-AT-0042]|nr:hypothetical protein BKA70DRAFT_1578101 [Coprinopsis sp. MPI-PUGE-AT-0042]
MGDLEAGTYTLVNFAYSRYALDTKDGLAVVSPYIACESQQWKLTTSDGVFWHVQNVESERYLGLPINKHVQNSLKLQELDHKFSWHVKRDENHGHHYLLYVPYTKHVVDMDPEDVKPGNGEVFVYEDGKGTHQSWHLCRAPSLRDGDVYKIAHAKRSVGSITFDNDTKRECEGSDAHKASLALWFRAIETDRGWAFQHVQTQRYLGIPHTVSLSNFVQISTVRKPFTWILIPDGGVSMVFEIWLPFTKRAIKLYRGGEVTLILQGLEEKKFWTCWRFEPCDEPSSSTVNEPLEADMKDRECMPGPEETPPSPITTYGVFSYAEAF